MPPAPITITQFSRIHWAVAALTAVCSLGLGWYLGGRPEVYWSMERERLHALVEYSQEVHVGSPLAEKAQQCWSDPNSGSVATHDEAFTVYMIGYGQDSCCIGHSCGSIGLQAKTWGGRAVMILDKKSARSFGVRTVVDARGEHLADRLVVVTDAHATVKGIFRNLDSDELDAALRYSLERPSRGPSMLAFAMDRLHAWANNEPRRL